MKKGDLRTIEQRMKISLPADYKTLMLGIPKELTSVMKCEQYDVDKPLYESRATIVKSNEAVRKPSFESDFGFDARDPRSKWPAKYFIIGGDIGGNFYCIKLARKVNGVFFWHHDSAQFEQCSKSLVSFIEYVFKHYGDLAARDLREKIARPAP